MSTTTMYERYIALKWDVTSHCANSEKVTHRRYGEGHYCLIRHHPTHNQPVLEFQPFWSAIELQTTEDVKKLCDYLWPQ